MRISKSLSSFLPLLFSTLCLSALSAILRPEDYAKLRDVSDPNLSPDGKALLYVVKTVDLEKDKRVSNIWLAKWDGSENRALTFGNKSKSHPRWSPDGKWIGFISGRDDDNEIDQLWIMSAQGGEAEKLSDTKGGVEDFAWAPDSKHIVAVVHDADPREPEKHEKENKTVPPIVIDRHLFKKDIDGYLTDRYSHLHLIEMATKKMEKLTSGSHDDVLPAWSSDSKKIAFVTKRGEDPDRTVNWDVYVIDARPGAKERQVTTSPEADADPVWESPPAFSPDGKYVAYLHGGDPKKIAYAAHSLAVIPTSGGEATILTQKLDRNVYQPSWSADGKTITVIVEDDRVQNLLRVRTKDGSFEDVTIGKRTVNGFDQSPDGKIVVLSSTWDRPYEIFALEKSKLRDLTKQNENFVREFGFTVAEETSFKSKDGTEIHGFIQRAIGSAAGTTPGLLILHGGPQSQYSHEFDFQKQLFAANGYTVIMPNPRGSTGRGTEYSMGIYAAWGQRDVEDDLAAVDDAVVRRLVDPNQLGVGGWSYGGISTNYIIASTTRFRAAASGASISNVFAGYGTDQYVFWYEAELGAPWKNKDLWLRLSYPFFHADWIKTPTLFMCGESDFNVPVLNSEQMYQALRSLGIPSQLVIYPGQFHGFTKPSYIIDRSHRYLDWYAKWIPAKSAQTTSGAVPK